MKFRLLTCYGRYAIMDFADSAKMFVWLLMCTLTKDSFNVDTAENAPAPIESICASHIVSSILQVTP